MSDSTDQGPLSKLHVLELGSTIAGPFCGRLLADFGANVIKVEDLAGDTLRTIGKMFRGTSLYAASLFRNKSTICIDLRKPEGQALVKKLAARCDIVIENFRPGALESWGLGYEDLKAVNAGLVMVRISGFGQTGPYSRRPGYGVIGEAVSGLRYINGDPDRPPARMATALTDYITGLYAAFGALVALVNRQFTGRGQCVDAALSECAFSFMEPFVPAFEKLGVVAQRAGSRLADATPNNLYATRDQDFIHIAAFSDPVFTRLCEVMEQPGLSADERFKSARVRNDHADEIDEIISRWTGEHRLGELEELLLGAGVPATRIFSIADIFKDAHYSAREMLVPTPDDDLGTITLAGPVPKLSDSPGKLRHTGHKVGQDTRTVLKEMLGLSAPEIERLTTSGIVR